ncbi:MAG: hypothetical protein AB8B87_24570, partial [Granulosicoccus sp.]
AAIANANPFRTGISAFTLGLGKIVAPMAFVYAPVLLIVSSTGFDLLTFSYTATSCIIGVFFLSSAVVGYLKVSMGAFQRTLLALSGVVMIAPGFQADMIALAIAAPALLIQWRQSGKGSGELEAA